MNESPLHLAKREMHESFSNKTLWICLLAGGTILGLSGPFDTASVIPLLPRVVYWLTLSSAFFFVGSFVGTWSHAALERHGWTMWPATITAGALAGIVIFVLLVMINLALFDFPIDCMSCMVTLGANVVGISVIVTSAVVKIKMMMASGQAVATTIEPAPILRRLPFDKRGALISISVNDHYVDVITDKGQELLLLRLSDAMAEVGETKGMQVHRSHWVALDQITSARRDGAKAILTMSDGRDIPASRTYVSALKEAGVLPE
ncbi:MAG: LytTR family DNA-binding domain-containing protein [Cognatishimia sp.]